MPGELVEVSLRDEGEPIPHARYPGQGLRLEGGDRGGRGLWQCPIAGVPPIQMAFGKMSMVDVAVKAPGSLDPDQPQPEKQSEFSCYTLDLDANGAANLYGCYVPMDEEELHHWLQRDTPVTTSDNLNGALMTEVVMNNNASDSLGSVQSEPMPCNQKPFPILVSREYLQRRGNNSTAVQQEDSRQSENDKEVVESGWRIYLAIFPLSLVPMTLICIGTLHESSQQSETDKEAIESGWKICLMNFVGSSGLILAIYHMQDHPTKACIALIIVAFIFSTNGVICFIRGAYSERGPFMEGGVSVTWWTMRLPWD
ncbi:hypothetical protein QJS04_geneDACA020446 [Acorus gramineus]|uniref:Uncharacterized protein n=1 Tax=Acorus gramineus TaxID=55184 RepID=A0AAV9BTJ0_ACOGR|nr:hypothetical protein QJS04_geneDACA020446 [Acorus gramineus]